MTRQCAVQGCSEPQARQSRCQQHNREYMREYMRMYSGYYDKVVCAFQGCRRRPCTDDGLCDKHRPRRSAPTRQVECIEAGCSELKYSSTNRCYEHHRIARKARDAAYREAHREQRRARKASPDVARRSSQSRRARRLGAFVETVSLDALLERDRCRCGLCGKRISRRLRYPHPGSASLDHIVPLAHGGTHEYRNAQPAHLRCNLRKSDGVVGHGEQLRLIA